MQVGIGTWSVEVAPSLLNFTMKYFITFLCWVALQTLSAQPAQTTVDLQKATLAERFQIMKSKSQTYEEYKVVKETVLDGVWKIVMDSLNFRKAQLHESGATIATLEHGLRSTQEALKQKEASLQDLIFDGTHISLLGINFGKKTFPNMIFEIK